MDERRPDDVAADVAAEECYEKMQQAGAGANSFIVIHDEDRQKLFVGCDTDESTVDQHICEATNADWAHYIAGVLNEFPVVYSLLRQLVERFGRCPVTKDAMMEVSDELFATFMDAKYILTFMEGQNFKFSESLHDDLVLAHLNAVKVDVEIGRFKHGGEPTDG